MLARRHKQHIDNWRCSLFGHCRTRHVVEPRARRFRVNQTCAHGIDQDVITGTGARHVESRAAMRAAVEESSKRSTSANPARGANLRPIDGPAEAYMWTFIDRCKLLRTITNRRQGRSRHPHPARPPGYWAMLTAPVPCRIFGAVFLAVFRPLANGIIS